MAAAEARAAWQRTANRYFVQEDAKRAPKLACCPSSSSKQVDVGPGDAANGPENASAGFVPLHWNPSYSNLPPDTKWWLQLQPNFGHQKDFTSEQLNVLEVELESLRNEELKRMSNISEDSPGSGDIPRVSSETKTDLYTDLHQRVSAICMKNNSETMVQELRTTNCNSSQKAYLHKSVGEQWSKDEESMDIDPVNPFFSKEQGKLFDMESPWMEGEKTEPWWRTADRDELASLVAQKSLDHVENCDLPPPQTVHISTGPFSCRGRLNQDGISCFHQKERSGGCSSVDHFEGCLTCSVNGKQHGSDRKGFSYDFDKSFSTQSDGTSKKDPIEAGNTPESEPSKAELLEALRHSQTRAREAENAAQKAYDEKEHIVKLFFRQASHLFAYKQWLQLLQLDSICLQLKNKDKPISTLFPMFLPWMPYKGRKLNKGKHKTAKKKHYQPGCGIGRYAVAFAVGLGLAGAGLLLGWTMGWLFPMF